MAPEEETAIFAFFLPRIIPQKRIRATLTLSHGPGRFIDLIIVGFSFCPHYSIFLGAVLLISLDKSAALKLKVSIISLLMPYT